MIFKLFDGPMDGAIYALSRDTSDPDQRSTTRKPDGLWFNAQDEHGRNVQHQYKEAGLLDLPGQYGMALKYVYDGQVVDTGIEMETKPQSSE